MKIKELREMDTMVLKEKLSELQLSLIKENVQVRTGTQVKNPGMIKKTKKTIARIHTILNEKDNENKLEVKTE